MRAGTSENRKNTEFATILEMGLREAYPHRDLAVLAHGALKDTHTEHPAALGRKRRWCLGERGGGVAPKVQARQLLCACILVAVPGTP